MMPTSIKYFERIMLGALALNFITHLKEYVTDISAPGAVTGLIAGIVTLAILLLLILLTSRKRNNIAKWILVVLMVIGIAIAVYGIITVNVGIFVTFGLNILDVILSAIVLVAHCAGLYFLFAKDSIAWFRKTQG